MKFKFKIKNSVIITMIALLILILVGSGFIIARIVQNGAEAFSIVSLIFAVIVLIMLSLLVFNTSYTFHPDYLKISLGIIVQKIKYSDMVVIKNYIKHKEMFLIFRPEKQKEEGDLTQILINIKPELYTDFVENLKAKNNMIVYDEINADIQEEE